MALTISMSLFFSAWTAAAREHDALGQQVTGGGGEGDEGHQAEQEKRLLCHFCSAIVEDELHILAVQQSSYALNCEGRNWALSSARMVLYPVSERCNAETQTSSSVCVYNPP